MQAESGLSPEEKDLLNVQIRDNQRKRNVSALNNFDRKITPGKGEDMPQKNTNTRAKETEDVKPSNKDKDKR